MPGVHVPLTFEPLDVGQIFNIQPRPPDYLITKTIRATRSRPTPRTPPSPASTVPYVHSITSVPPSISDVWSRMLEAGCTISFQLSGEQGAALVTKYPTLREEIQRVGAFEKYIKEHYASWVEFASATGHGDVNPILVTGVDRTKDFAMLSYSNNADDLRSEFITSIPGDTSAHAWGTWHRTRSIHTNFGPQLYFPASSSMASSNNSTGSDSDEYNQCVFVRYYTMRKRLGIPRIIKASAGPHDLGPGGREDGKSPQVEARSPLDSSSEIASNFCDDDGNDDRSSVTSVESEHDSIIHNIATVCSLPSHPTILVHSD